MLAYVLVRAALSLGGCVSLPKRPPKEVLDAWYAQAGTGGDAGGGVLSLIMSQLIWLIVPLTVVTVAVWALAVWLPWISIRAAIGATMGLASVIVLIWILSILLWILSILAAYGFLILAVLLLLVAWWKWPWLRMQWRKRGDYAAGIDDIKQGRLSHGLGNLSLAGVRTTNGDGEVRIGGGLRRKRVRIGGKGATTP